MQIEKLLEEHRAAFVKYYLDIHWSSLKKSKELESEANIMFQLHKSSLKQFIDGLVEYSQDKLEKCKKLRLSKYLHETPEYFDGKIAILEDQIFHLKEITKQLE
jgi:hypothetical protein